MQIASTLQQILETDSVAVVIDAKHLCVSMRGVEDSTSSTVTTCFLGDFQKDEKRKEFLSLVNS